VTQVCTSYVLKMKSEIYVSGIANKNFVARITLIRIRIQSTNVFRIKLRIKFSRVNSSKFKDLLRLERGERPEDLRFALS